MPTQREYDVAIVGASIAGCAAAMFLARRGARVALIERDSDPAAYNRLCTHFIQPSAVPTLEKLGLAGAIEDAGGVRSEMEIFTRWGWIAAPAESALRRRAYGYNIRRSKLDPLLRRRVSETEGVDFMPGLAVAGLLTDGSAFCGITACSEDGERRDIEARLVVGADGRGSSVAEFAGLPARAARNGRVGYFAYYRNLPLAGGSKSRMWFLDPDVAYAFPSDDGVSLLAAMPARSKAAEWEQDPEAAMIRLFEGLPRAPSLESAERIGPYIGVDCPSLRRRPTGPGLALIGDAAFAVDPLAAAGCGWALQSAEWLAMQVQDWLTGRATLKSGLEGYANRLSWKLDGHQFLLKDYSTGRRHNLLERFAFSAAARDPACADNLMALESRFIGVSKFLRPTAVARAMWVNARHGLGLGRQAVPLP